MTEWISVDDVARRLDLHRTTVLRFLDSGALPSTRLGPRRLVDPADLADFVDACRVTPGTLGRNEMP